VTRPCIAVLGGSFDPVHRGHIALAEYCAGLFQADVLRIVPAGRPWQKGNLNASSEQRVAMLALAFARLSIPVQIDRQEIERAGNSYTVDTLQAIRAEIGADASLLLVIGADQLHGLNTWHAWRDLFSYGHVCVVSRPDFHLAMSDLPKDIANEFGRRLSTPEKLRDAPSGLSCLAPDLQNDISSTAVRNSLRQGICPDALVPPAVLDYIQQHHLYQN
jgi:nicotinate-nucleotide adenylyltransferase